jgi:lysozyme
MKISENGLELIKVSEGFVPHAYPDPASGGDPWTIAYGHTVGVRPGDTCTPAQGDVWLREDSEEDEHIIAQWVTAPLTQGQYDALVSFLYNIGPGIAGVHDGLVWLRSGYHSTLLRKLNASDYAGAAAEFPKWANPPLPGLKIRRAREQLLFKGGDWRAIHDLMDAA